MTLPPFDLKNGRIDRSKIPPWPPAWNPFELFLLILSVVSSVGLLRGQSGSALLDERLSTVTVVAWGLCLALGSLLALAGVYCYRRLDTLVPGLYLERSGLLLVGVAATIYSVVLIGTAADIDGVRWVATVTVAYALACFTRAGQDQRAIRTANKIAGRRPWGDLWDSLRPTRRQSERGNE